MVVSLQHVGIFRHNNKTILIMGNSVLITVGTIFIG